MKILVDTNILLDVLLDRKLHVAASTRVWAAVETGKVAGFIAAHAVTTIHYLVQREQGSSVARRNIAALLQVFGVASVDGDVIRKALELSWPDFEDSVTASAARAASCDGIVTRDPRGFPRSPIRVFTPEAAAAILMQ